MIAAALLAPLVKGAAVVSLALAVTWGVYNAGQRAERAKCDAGALRAELAAARADLDAARRAAQNAEALGQKLSELETQNRELADEIASTAGACVASQSDVDRLRRVK
jgi:hypothetical protein